MVFGCVDLHNFLRLEDSNDDFDTFDLPPESPRSIASTDAVSDEDDDLQSELTQQVIAGTWRSC